MKTHNYHKFGGLVREVNCQNTTFNMDNLMFWAIKPNFIYFYLGKRKYAFHGFYDTVSVNNCTCLDSVLLKHDVHCILLIFRNNNISYRSRHTLSCRNFAYERFFHSGSTLNDGHIY